MIREKSKSIKSNNLVSRRNRVDKDLTDEEREIIWDRLYKEQFLKTRAFIKGLETAYDEAHREIK